MSLKAIENKQESTTRKLPHRRNGFDRRLGKERRSLFSIKYLFKNKPNRRKGVERRQHEEKRADWVRTGKWTSVCSLFITKVEYWR